MVGEGIHGIDFAFVAGKFATPFWQWWDMLMLWLALIHGANGMRTIINDYITHPKRPRACWCGRSWLSAAFLILLGTLVVFTFDPCLGVDAGQRPLGACARPVRLTGAPPTTQTDRRHPT